MRRRKWGSRGKWLAATRIGGSPTLRSGFRSSGRWKSRKPIRLGQISKKKVYGILMLAFVFFTIESFSYIDRNLKQPILKMADVRVKQIATEAINQAVSDKISRNENLDQLIEWKYDNSGKIAGFMLNYAEHMKIASDTVDTVQSTLQRLSMRKEDVPLGQALNSPILASFGPEIPVRFLPVGDVKVDLNTKQINAGINMLLVEVYIRVTEEVSIIIPFESQPDTFSTDIPITYLLVKGDVPMYYYDAQGNPLGGGAPLPPSVTLPSPNQAEGTGGTGQSFPSGARPGVQSGTGVQSGGGVQSGTGVQSGGGVPSGSSTGVFSTGRSR